MIDMPDSAELFVRKKVKLLLKIFLVLMTVIGMMSLIRLIEGDYTQALADIFFFLIVVYGYLKLHQKKLYYLSVVRIVFAAAFAASVFLLFNHPDNPIRFIWISTVVYMVFYLFDRKESAYWIALSGILFLILFVFRIEGLKISLVEFLTWIMNMVVVLMIAYWYAEIEEEASGALLHAKKRLSDEVEQKTYELRLRQTQLEEKTKELQKLNETLEEKVRIETEKNRQQEEVLFRQARYAQMGEMISMIAHQWRQPLNAIATLNATINIKNDTHGCDQPFLEEKTRLIAENVKHLSSTIDDFRSFFRMDKHKKTKMTDEIIDDTLRLLKSALESKDIAIVKEMYCNCKVLTYPNEIVHVLLNLLKNAEDAFVSRKIETPVITIRTVKKDEYALIEVEDNAGSIEEGIMEKIFDPYFTTKDENVGTGLGLYMSRLIIHDHCGGKMEAKNTEEGVVFSVYLPHCYDNEEQSLS